MENQTLAPLSQAAWKQLVELLASGEESFLAPHRGVKLEHDQAAGYRSLTHLLGYAVDLYLDNDPLRPSLVQLASPVRKMLGDNVDSHYHFTQLDPTRSYRLYGRKGNHCYLGFCVYAGPRDGSWSDRIAASMSHRDIEFEDNGAFELSLVPVASLPGAGENGPSLSDAKNVIALDEDVSCLIVRQYFFDRDEAEPAELEIEMIEDIGPPVPLSDQEMADRLRAATRFVEQTMGAVPMPDLGEANDFLGFIEFDKNASGWGTTDNVYALGNYSLADDEALVVEGHPQPCCYFGLQLWNRYMQSLDYRYQRVAINGEQLEFEDDGSYRVIISAVDPGLPNWISTAGHPEGVFFCRWLLADGDLDMPSCSVVPVDSLRVGA